MSDAPSFTPFLYRALRKVARSEIGAVGPTGALRHRTDELSPRLISALFMLRRDGYIQLGTQHRTGTESWIPAELTLRGTQLLGHWMRTHPSVGFSYEAAASQHPPQATSQQRSQPRQLRAVQD
ncbi:hypothetical protein [Haloactinomyces albus]|uniref:Uncharacterized protein n=1 Tax=Haloactinomyces albus TaxID=1352928 RepID=A0AAE3ZEK8_9ACTN|nr:hypothetical protein [Haloactinomyces albus]MDR7303513.1 hypothetical protein [Haloactinomyces albus]